MHEFLAVAIWHRKVGTIGFPLAKGANIIIANLTWINIWSGRKRRLSGLRWLSGLRRWSRLRRRSGLRRLSRLRWRPGLRGLARLRRLSRLTVTLARLAGVVKFTGALRPQGSADSPLTDAGSAGTV